MDEEIQQQKINATYAILKKYGFGQFTGNTIARDIVGAIEYIDLKSQTVSSKLSQLGQAWEDMKAAIKNSFKR